jgi:acyl-coenzyme A thioesterase PaaI-like protein
MKVGMAEPDSNPLTAASGEHLPWSQPDAPTERQLQQRRLAAATRGLIEHVMAMSAPEDELARAAVAIEAITQSLSGMPRRIEFEGFAEAANSGDPHNHYEHSPFAGPGNPIAMPMAMEVHPDRVIGRVTYGSAYEGPPGHVHGGHVAAAFDEVLGLAQDLGGNPGMTGTLSIRYRRPTPLHTPLVFEGWLEDVSGRKTRTRGTVSANGEVCAEAEALFISITAEMFEKLIEKRTEKLENRP